MSQKNPSPQPNSGSNPQSDIQFDLNPSLAALRSKSGRFDFNQARFRNNIELIKDKSSTLYNFGPLLISKMEEIQNEGQAYFWGMRKKGITPKEKKLREGYAKRKKIPFVRFGDYSDDTAVGKKGRWAGDFDQLSKPQGTTNCSTAVLDALYRALGGQMDAKGNVKSVGGVNGVPLSDAAFSGFPKKFQGPDWDDAIEDYKLGYKVAMKDLQPGDIISMPGHRMVYVSTISVVNGIPKKIWTIEAKPPTGKAIVRKERTIKKDWKAARIFDIKP